MGKSSISKEQKHLTKEKLISYHICMVACFDLTHTEKAEHEK